jgi:protein deglycase
MDKCILVPLAEGFEMLEALSIVDVFRRAGVHVDLASISDKRQVTSSHGVPVIADILLTDCLDRSYDLIALPGGIPGAINLKDSKDLVVMLKRQQSENKFYGAICASPALVLEHHGLLEGKKATCHPGFVENLSCRDRVAEKVVIDGNCITSRGAGTSIDFALELLETIMGKEKRQEVAKQIAIAD